MDNEENPYKFGIPFKEGIYQKYVGKYYIVRSLGVTDQYIGRIKGIDDKKGKITLNPYFGLHYSKEGDKNFYNLINKDFDAFVDLSKISFEPTTKESIFYNCGLSNKKGFSKKDESFFAKLKLAYKILFEKEK
ncbi:MAG: hypothetical protein AABX44_01615 [Nanoarchaeota archaeon]